MLKTPEKKQPLVRMDQSDKAELERLAEKTGESMPRLLHMAVHELKRQLFFKRMNESYSRLREDKEGWKAEIEDRKLFDNSTADGLA